MVHVSSVAAVGYTEDPAQPLPRGLRPSRRAPGATATTRTKRLGEEAVLRAVAEGQDVVVACPGFLLGAGDVENRINTFVVEEDLRSRVRAAVAGGIAPVDVRDVAERGCWPRSAGA